MTPDAPAARSARGSRNALRWSGPRPGSRCSHRCPSASCCRPTCAVRSTRPAAPCPCSSSCTWSAACRSSRICVRTSSPVTWPTGGACLQQSIEWRVLARGRGQAPGELGALPGHRSPALLPARGGLMSSGAAHRVACCSRLAIGFALAGLRSAFRRASRTGHRTRGQPAALRVLTWNIGHVPTGSSPRSRMAADGARGARPGRRVDADVCVCCKS